MNTYVGSGTILIGKKPEEGYVGGVTTNSLCILLSIESGVDETTGASMLTNLQNQIEAQTIQSLSQFENAVSSAIVQSNLPAQCDLAVGFILDHVLYVKTTGKSVAYYQRKGLVDELMRGTKTASGELQQGDMLVFTTEKCLQAFEGQTLKTFIQGKNQSTIASAFQEMVPNFSSEVFFVSVEFMQHEVEQTPVVTTQSNQPSQPQQPLMSAQPPIQQQSQPVIAEEKKRLSLPSLSIRNIVKSKIFIVGVALALIGILLWSVVFGYQRRQSAQLKEKIDQTQEEIETLLVEAEDLATLDSEKATVILDESKKILAQLTVELEGKNRDDDLKKIEKRIAEVERIITKREEKTFDEFYDLALEDESAKAIKTYLEGSSLALFDKNNSRVYVLDLDSKSLEEYTSAEIENAIDIALYQGNPYVFHPDKGVVRFSSNSAVELLIPPDEEWGSIVDLAVYNGNIYLLDQKNDEIYKYLVAENGFSDKQSYFGAGESLDLSKAKDMVIDGSIFINLSDSVVKFTRGVRESFNPNLPTENPSLSMVYTNVDDETLYMLDTQSATVFLSNKEDVFQKQIQTSLAKTAIGFFSYDGRVYICTDTKIYSAPLD